MKGEGGKGKGGGGKQREVKAVYHPTTSFWRYCHLQPDCIGLLPTPAGPRVHVSMDVCPLPQMRVGAEGDAAPEFYLERLRQCW